MSPDGLSVVVRSLSFVLLFQAIGAAIFTALFAELESSALALRRLMMVAAIGGALAVSTHLTLEATRMTGDFSGLVNPSMQRRVFTSSAATSHGMQVLGLLLVALAARGRERHRAVVSSIGGVIAVAAFLFVGHTSVHPWRALLAPLLALHLLIVAFWFGSLLPLWIVSRGESVAVATAVLQEFSELATWLVPVIAIAGLVMTLVIANGVPPLNEPYGALILTKVFGFAVLMGLAAWNKWRLVPAITADAGKSLAALRRSVLTEFVLIVAILGVTAVMTAFFSPNE